MNLDVALESLTRAVRIVAHALRDAADGRAVLVLSATTHHLIITATGRSMTISRRVSAVAVRSTGTACVPGRLFVDVLASAHSPLARLAVDGSHLAIDLGETSASLRLVDVDPPAPLSVSAASITADEVKRSAAIAMAASADVQRPVLTGVHFGPGVAEATDSYRIARTNLADWALNVTIPTDVVRQVVSAGADVRCRFDGRVISLAAENTTWTCATAVDRYPDLGRFFAKPTVETLACDRHELLRALDASAAIPGAFVDLHGRGDHLAVCAESAEIGRIETTVASPGRAGLEAIFTGSYLRDSVRLATGNQIRIELSSKQAIIRCESFSQLLMRRIEEDD